ncbi:hypothetical protein MVES1_000669 [Malassezia vespertilionis]|uniref:uncharacterized protein n=1 Tax=Malassezia vespertilionis TaxID=2020962 RepID=UPI0024B1CB85|nr:uncharacterized protein MVES1_000669 [Malassezia vespertilionis]WFD05339.1 hypothetical protein MVES1_000669 [Malassezia vespertilionis]
MGADMEAMNRLSPSVTGAGSDSYFTDKVNLGFPRLSALSLSGSPPPRSPSGSDSESMSPYELANASPESPPKVRSNIALPPRSGYSLSDDSDNPRSEGDGSNSGVSSSGSENEQETAQDEEEEDEDAMSHLQRWRMRQASAACAMSDKNGERGNAFGGPAYESRQFFRDDDDDDTSNDADAEDEDKETKPQQNVPAEDELDDVPMDVSASGQAAALTDTTAAASDPELEDGLSSLERIFLFAKSDMAYHRVLISRCLADWIKEVDLTDAVEYVIPLLNGLATDEIEVSAVFAPELGRLMWFFFRNCPIAELATEQNGSDMSNTEDEIMPRPRIPVSIFSPLLCTLLLNPNSAVSGATQASIVEYFLRSKHCNDAVDEEPGEGHTKDADLVVQGVARENKLVPLAPYDFDCTARELVLSELFENVAIAISRFDGCPRKDGEDLWAPKKLGAQLTSRSRYDEESAMGRMMSVNLLAAIAVEGGFSAERLAVRVVPEITSRPQDPAFFVRKEVAAAIGILGKALVSVLPKNSESGEFDYRTTDAPKLLLAAANRVLLDHVWQVRQAACYSLPGVFATQPAGPRRRGDLVICMRALHQDVSPNVQLAAFEMIGEIIYLFHNDEEGVPPELVRLFLGQRMVDPTPQEKESGDADACSSLSPLAEKLRCESEEPGNLLCNPDRSLIVAFNFPAVVLTMTSQRWDELRELYLQLTHHVYENVRNSLAASLHEIAKLIGTQAAERDLVPVVEQFIRDPCAEVTATLLEHIDEFWYVLSPECVKNQLQQLPMLWLSQLSRDWRLRETIARHITSIAPSLLLTDEDGCLVTLLLLALNDPIYAVRDIGVQAVHVTYTTFRAHDEAVADGFLSMLGDLVEASAYRQRVTFLYVVRALVQQGIAADRFEALLLKHLVCLGTDSVRDVRIALARTVRQVWYAKDLYPTDAQRSDQLKQLAATLARDQCHDVSEPVSDLLNNEERSHFTQSIAQPSPAPRKLELGPARPLLDSTVIPWREVETQEELPASENASAQMSFEMEEDVP